VWLVVVLLLGGLSFYGAVDEFTNLILVNVVLILVLTV
jgi:hypothetical protein